MPSERGAFILKKVKELINSNQLPPHFSAGMVSKLIGEKVSGNTLSALGHHGYLIREGGSPVVYHLASEEDIANLMEAENGPALNHDVLLAAKKLKRDELYTHFEDIENEVMRYRKYFNNKKVLLNCNDGNWSNFFKFFVLNFDSFNLKQLVSLDYGNDPKAYILKDDLNQDGFIDESDLIVEELKGDGSYSSEEGLKYLNECDIVVTNPPFSKFNDFLKVLIDSNKQFLILGNNNALSYQDVFKYIKDNKVWLGYNTNKVMNFNLPSNYQELGYEVKGIKDNLPYGTIPAISWFTNLPNKKRNEPQILINSYGDGKNYPCFDNHPEIININRITQIPKDYKGLMGVPITYLNVYCPEQFELIALMASTTVTETNWGYPYVYGKKKYARVIIRNKSLN